MKFCFKKFFSWRNLFLIAIFFGMNNNSRAATEVVGLVRQDCSGYSNCFTSLSAWESAYGGINFGSCATGDLVCADTIATAKVDGTWINPDASAVTINGWTTDASRYINIYTTPQARHDGTWGPGYRRTTPLIISEENVRIDGISIRITDNNRIYFIYNTSGAGEVRISNSFGQNDYNSGYDIYDIYYVGPLTVKLWNNIGINNSTNSGAEAFFLNDADVNAYFYNNTGIANAGRAFYNSIGAGTLINNIGVSATGQAYRANTGQSWAASYNISDDSTSDDWGGTGNKINQAAAFSDSTNGNYHLSSSDSAAKDAGIDLSSDSAISFSTDIDGEIRAGSWDIGADEYNGSAPPPPQDTIPPYRSGGSPTGTLGAGTTQATLSLTTNENAACRYSTTAGAPYLSMMNTFSTTGGTLHSAFLTGLQNGRSYNYYVRCVDSLGNSNPDDFLISFYVNSVSSSPFIVADHRAVDDFNIIPDYWIEQIKSRRLVASVFGQSHARQFHYGFQLLETQNSKYSADVAYNPGSFINDNSLRDLTGKYSSAYSSWSEFGGASTYWTDDAAKTTQKNTIRQAAAVFGYPVSASIYGWSYHMCNPAYATGEIGHPFGDADLQLYLNALTDFNTDSTVNSTKFLYTTSVSDCNTTYGADMNRWNDMIRQAASANSGILFDQADIENWNNTNTSQYINSGQYLRNPDYSESVTPNTYAGDHANDALDIRKAKALWWLMARLAGWNGAASGADTTPPAAPQGLTVN
ncbi:MAG: hypothetical protein NUV83_03035 [Candidatus Wolfebacteria bacterium]|nr:hypothetical protein [Candidatus Wolfebacteria bacterium]